MADYDLATTLSPCSQRDSGYSEDGVTPPISPYASEVTDPQPADPFHTTTELPNRDVSQEQCITSALANEAFKTLRAQQKEEMRRVVVFERQQQRALEHFQQGTLKKSSEKLERDKAEKEEQHAADLEKLDEAHILAEHELRKSQATEVQNVATALKYMEAYCSGSNPVSPSTTHNVTEEDRKKLARQHQIQQNLPRKHESAVNVLRARQEKQLQVRMERQEAEMQKLETDFETAKTAAEWQLSQDISRLSTMSQARRKRCTNRWELKFEIWRRDWEAQHGKPLEGRLPGVQWDEVENEEQELLDEEIRSSSSLAVFFEL